MIVAIMQPYFFPYLGYFQLMHRVQRFVFYDDAQFMKGGWINRNRILLDGAPAWWTHALVRDDHRLPINRRCYSRDPQARAALKNKLAQSYRGAPRFEEVAAFVGRLLDDAPDNIARANRGFLQATAARLGLQCGFLASSELDVDPLLRGQDRVLAICRALGATTYVNAIGGTELYDAEAFRAAGIELRFLRSLPTDYRQFERPHVPYLSIVDAMMFNAAAEFPALLGHAELQAA